MSARADDPTPNADSLFATWLGRNEAGEEADFEALCREHPAADSELRRLHDHWARVEAVRLQHGLGGSPSVRLATRHGGGIDPQVTLEGEELVVADFSSAVLSRLAGRGPASTRYRVKGEVAHGGMGAVLRVWDQDLRRHLAMKVMLGKGVVDEQGDTPHVDPRLLARFLEEAQVTAQLDHPGIVPVHELGLDPEGRVYFTMKLVKGKTLKDVFAELGRGQGDWTPTRVLGLILKVCEAMSYAHAKGVIHRDLKPANIMVGTYGEVFVMDWGLAKILGRPDPKNVRIREDHSEATTRVHSDRKDQAVERPDSPLATMDGDVVGTPAYMSPEQALGRVDDMGPPSDVYAVGAMLYHLVAGHMPYVPPGLRMGNLAVWRAVQAGPPPSLDDKGRDAAGELVAICQRAMARTPSSRYADMAALAADLSAYVEGRVVRAYETGTWAETRKWVQRNMPLAASLAAAVLAVVLGGAGFAVKAREASKAADRARENEDQAKANLTLARDKEAEAREQQLRAEAETAKVLRLSDAKVLQELEREADELWPAHPDRIAAMESWLDRARELAVRLPGHRATLTEMRDRAGAWSDIERGLDRETHPRLGELAARKAELEGLIERLEAGLRGQDAEQADRRVAELEPEIAGLTAEVESRRSWTLDSPEVQWQHDVLAELIGELERLETGLLADDVITTRHGWSVPKRLAFARELERGFAEGGEYARAWAAALPAVTVAYPGLELGPQMGLVPVGPDPKSGLWEFAHLATGEPAERGSDGKLLLTEETGVVLMLLHPGTFWMGAQSLDLDARNHDPQAQADESPVHEVELSACFLSKYELTQGQWLRLTGHNPSYYQLSELAPTLLHPVEQIRWDDCMAWLPRGGLALPSEAQWEYGARAGTDTPWWTGAERESLRESGAANLADQAAARAGGPWQDIKDWPELDDGFAVHAPIGTYAANGFGLQEVTGNVWEWCLDGYDPQFYSRSPRLDPVRPWVGAPALVNRGGCFSNAAFAARSSIRAPTPSFASYNLGVRPARAIDP